MKTIVKLTDFQHLITNHEPNCCRFIHLGFLWLVGCCCCGFFFSVGGKILKACIEAIADY